MSLSTHLRTSGDHAVLPFDPACPVCRQAAPAGTLSARPLVPPRVTALAVAGVTAGCALAPAPGAMAQEPPVELPSGGYEDPGEEALEDEGPLVEDEPVESDQPDPNLPPPVLPDDEAMATEPAPDENVAADPPPPPPAAPAPAPAPPAPPVAQPQPQPSPKRERPNRAAPATRVAPQEARAPAHPAPRVELPPAPAGASYVVRSGDSLWSIARARLGGGASAAAVARLVQAIWHANAAVIRTGDPDLLHPGTRLILPGARG